MAAHLELTLKVLPDDREALWSYLFTLSNASTIEHVPPDAADRLLNALERAS